MTEPVADLSRTPFRLDRWRIDAAARRVADDARDVRLRPKAMGVLVELAKAAPGVVSREDLLARVWPGVFVGEEVLTHAISELRQVFRTETPRGGVIETVQKAGYRLAHLPEPLDGPTKPHRSANSAAVLEAQFLMIEARDIRARNGKGAPRRALDLSAAAAELAPDFAPVLAEHAHSMADVYLFSPGERPALTEALAIADQAVAVAPDLSDGHVARGIVLDALGDSGKACAAFAEAVARDPKNADAWYAMARAYYAISDYRRAALAALEASRLDPADFNAAYLASGAFRGLGDHDRARATARQALTRATARRAMDPTEVRASNIVSSLQARAGEKDAALSTIAAYEARGGLVTNYNVGTYAATGDIDLALDRLEESVETGYRHFRWMVNDPVLKPLHRERRFQRLAKLA